MEKFAPTTSVSLPITRRNRLRKVIGARNLAEGMCPPKVKIPQGILEISQGKMRFKPTDLGLQGIHSGNATGRNSNV